MKTIAVVVLSFIGGIAAMPFFMWSFGKDAKDAKGFTTVPLSASSPVEPTKHSPEKKVEGPDGKWTLWYTEEWTPEVKDGKKGTNHKTTYKKWTPVFPEEEKKGHVAHKKGGKKK